MKNLRIALLTLGALALMAAGVLINGNQINPQSGINISTMTVTGATGITATTNVNAGGEFIGPGTGLTGTAASLQAGTAAALAAAPSLCSAGNYPLGIAANGNAQSCSNSGILSAGINKVIAVWSGASTIIAGSGASGVQAMADAAGNWLLYLSTAGAQSLTASPGTAYVPAAGGLNVAYGVTAGTGTVTGTLNVGGAVSEAGFTSTSSGTVQSQLQVGSPTSTVLSSMGQIIIPMKSIDGVTQSSGCVVMYQMSANTGLSTDALEFTSTATANNGAFGILLDNNCAPGSICRIGVKGIFRSTLGSGNCGAANNVGTSSTRCQLTANSTASPATSGAQCVAPYGSSGGATYIWIP